MPDVSCVSAELTVLHVTGSGFEEPVMLRSILLPNHESFYANRELFTAAVGEMDYDKTRALAGELLDAAGVQYDPDSLFTDWGGSEPHNGLAVEFTAAEPVFEISSGGVSEELFTDYTHLGDHIERSTP
jgi:hypothetical protein